MVHGLVLATALKQQGYPDPPQQKENSSRTDNARKDEIISEIRVLHKEAFSHFVKWTSWRCSILVLRPNKPLLWRANFWKLQLASQNRFYCFKCIIVLCNVFIYIKHLHNMYSRLLCFNLIWNYTVNRIVMFSDSIRFCDSPTIVSDMSIEHIVYIEKQEKKCVHRFFSDNSSAPS